MSNWKAYRRERIELLSGKIQAIQNRQRIAMLPGSVASQVYTDTMQRLADEIARLQTELARMQDALRQWQHEAIGLTTERDLALAEIGFLRAAKSQEECDRASRDAAKQVIEMRRLMG